MKLTPHFSLHEMTYSRTAARHGIKNVPNKEQTENLRLLCVNVMEPVRELVGGPVLVSSGFRCPALNRHRKVNGARNSQHQTARAADFSVHGMTTKELFEKICASDIPFDQIIEEFGEWVHISYDATREPRRSMLIATRDESGGVKYTKYEPSADTPA